MNRQTILDLLGARAEELREHYGVASMSLFGSAVRDELREDSDVDLLVRFRGPATLRGYCALKDFLETLLVRHVDLVSENALRIELRPIIEKERIRVA